VSPQFCESGAEPIQHVEQRWKGLVQLGDLEKDPLAGPSHRMHSPERLQLIVVGRFAIEQGEFDHML
jgi:hypothetical protein